MCVRGGLVFADLCWNAAPSGHPFHLVEGEVSGDGPWQVGPYRVREITHGDPLAEAWNTWTAYRLEALQGDRLGQHSIRITRRWRIGFRWQDGDAYDVEIVDYY